MATEPPKTKPSLRKQNERFRRNRDEAVRKITHLNTRSIKARLESRKATVISDKDGQPTSV